MWSQVSAASSHRKSSTYSRGRSQAPFPRPVARFEAETEVTGIPRYCSLALCGPSRIPFTTLPVSALNSIHVPAACTWRAFCCPRNLPLKYTVITVKALLGDLRIIATGHGFMRKAMGELPGIVRRKFKFRERGTFM